MSLRFLHPHSFYRKFLIFASLSRVSIVGFLLIFIHMLGVRWDSVKLKVQLFTNYIVILMNREFDLDFYSIPIFRLVDLLIDSVFMCV